MRRITFDSPRVGAFVCERAGITNPGMFQAFGIEDEQGEIIGGALYNEYNGSNVCVHIASKSRFWVTRELLRIMADYPFNQLKVRRLTGYVTASNKEAQKFDEHIGFNKEAVLKQAAPNGEDLIVYVMFRDDCRYLENRDAIAA